MSCFRGAWQSLYFYKEYLFGFETLVFATLHILSKHNQLEKHCKDKRKLEITSYYPFKINLRSSVLNCAIMGHHEYELKCTFNILSVFKKNI